MLVGGAVPGDVDGGGACREGDGEEAVVALEVGWEFGGVAGDAPVGEVAEVEDEGFGLREVESEVCRCVGGESVGGWVVGVVGGVGGGGVGGGIGSEGLWVGGEPVGWVVGAEGVVVGEVGGVFVGGSDAVVSGEGLCDGGGGVGWVAGLAVEVDAEEGEGERGQKDGGRREDSSRG